MRPESTNYLGRKYTHFWDKASSRGAGICARGAAAAAREGGSTRRGTAAGEGGTPAGSTPAAGRRRGARGRRCPRGGPGSRCRRARPLCSRLEEMRVELMIARQPRSRYVTSSALIRTNMKVFFRKNFLL